MAAMNGVEPRDIRAHGQQPPLAQAALSATLLLFMSDFGSIERSASIETAR
jgi:hypothetical protein